MKKKVIIGIILIAIVILLCIIIGVKDRKSNISEQKGKDVCSKIESVLKDNSFKWEKQQKSGIVYGALDCYEYSLNDGSYIEIYIFDKKSEEYKQVQKTNKLHVLGTENRYDVIVIKEENAVIRYTHEGKKAELLKEILY